MLSELLQTVYPKGLKCIICQKELPFNTRYGVCNACRPGVIDNYCDCCGVEITGTKNFCDTCHQSKRVFTQAGAPFCFENKDIRKLIHSLKYGDKTYLAPYFAEFMADHFYHLGWMPDIITYVPIHRLKRIFIRGYDQSRLIAENLARILNLPLVESLVKTKFTLTSAAKLGREERRKLLTNSFRLIGDVRGKSILLIDDVYTSGATSEECTAVLRSGRARNVWIMTFATSKEKIPLYSPGGTGKTMKEFIKRKKTARKKK